VSPRPIPPLLLKAAENAINARYGHATLAGRAYDMSEPKSRAEFTEKLARDWMAVTDNLTVADLDELVWYLEDPNNKESD